MKKLFRTLFAAALCCLTFKATDACTNFIITRGASSDGSVMVSYAADSHQLYGALYKTFAGRYKPGTMLPVYDWDSGRYLGEIPQAAQTYATIGNMNEHSLIIAESTYGGREELVDSTGRIDYGSLIYITLQRAKTAREAIRIIVDLANTYGYASSGESFSIADRNPQGHRLGSSPHSRRIRFGTRQPVAHHDFPARRSRELPLRSRRDLLRP